MLKNWESRVENKFGFRTEQITFTLSQNVYPLVFKPSQFLIERYKNFYKIGKLCVKKEKTWDKKELLKKSEI